MPVEFLDQELHEIDTQSLSAVVGFFPSRSQPRPRSASPPRLYNLSAREAGTRGIRPTQKHRVPGPEGYETITAQDLLTTTGNYNPFIFAENKSSI